MKYLVKRKKDDKTYLAVRFDDAADYKNVQNIADDEQQSVFIDMEEDIIEIIDFSAGEQQKAYMGDWIVESDYGRLNVYTPRIFNATYRVAKTESKE